jgi:predicted ATPase
MFCSPRPSTTDWAVPSPVTCGTSPGEPSEGLELGEKGLTLSGPMIRSIQIEGFKSLRSFSLEPGRFTVLVGPNGAGKSSVLQALHLVARFAQQSPPLPEISLMSSGPLSSLGTPLPLTLGMSLGMTEKSFEQRTQEHLKKFFRGICTPEWIISHGMKNLSLDLTDNLGSLSLKISLTPSSIIQAGLALDGKNTEGMGNGERVQLFDLWASPALSRFTQILYLSLEVNKMTAPSAMSEEQPRLESDGAGLASVLTYLAGAEPDIKAAIEKDLRQVVPQVRRILTKPAKVSVLRKKIYPVGDQTIELPVEEEIWGQRFSLEMAGGTQVPAEQLSEGTVLALGLLTLLHGPEAPRLLLLDDLDRALHLGAQTRLVEILRRLLERRPELQVICTSHSPFLLQEIAPHDVLVMAPDEEGWSHACRLDQHPDYKRFRAALTTGELWATLGEDWVLAGEKVSA